MTAPGAEGLPAGGWWPEGLPAGGWWPEMVLTGPAATSEHGPTHVRAVSDTSAARPVDEPPDAAVWPPAPGEPGGPPWPWPVTASGAAPAASPAAGDQEPPTAADPSGAVGPTAAPPLTPAAATADLPTGKAEPARALIGEDVAALAPICDDQARGFAARFTADYLSWDEDVPQVRWQVLATYYADPAAAVLGWTGCGRQHVDLVIPGVVIRLSPQRLVVQTTARIVLHERIGPSSRPNRAQDELAPPPPGLQWAAASAPGAGSWRATATAWAELHVPVGRGADGGLEVQPRSVARHARPGAGAS